MQITIIIEDGVTKTVEESCEYCKYFNDYGCRRYPKQVTSIFDSCTYPSCRKTEWCGEFKSKFRVLESGAIKTYKYLTKKAAKYKL